MKDAVNAAAGGDGVPTRRIAGDAGREYILQTEEDTKAKAAFEAGLPLSAQCDWLQLLLQLIHAAVYTA